MRLSCLPLLAALLLMPAPVSAQSSPREATVAVAERIRGNYFSPQRGDEIADALEAEAARGAFDAFVEPRDLAAALTRRLRPLDGHFSVVHDPHAPQGPVHGMRGAPPAGLDAALRRDNYGFRRVEILPGNIGYIDLRQFTNIRFSDPQDAARRAADAALDLFEGTDAVIIDLRANGGGAPSMVGYLVSAFTPPDAAIYNVFQSRQGQNDERPAAMRSNPRLDVPVYVLISGRSGSAAEALPYTLQAARRAVIVGETSAGAANPGGQFPTPQGLRVFVPTGSPRNPLTGGNWEGVGVAPDVAAPSEQALVRAQILALETLAAADPARTDVNWALESLRADHLPADLQVYAGVYQGVTGEIQATVEDGRLRLQQGRRPAMILRPVAEDLFAVENEPGRRYRFLRGDDGGVSAFEVEVIGAPPLRAPRL